MNENQRWSIKIKTDYLRLIDDDLERVELEERLKDDTKLSLGKRDEQFYELYAKDHEIAEILQQDAFCMQVKSCICKTIAGQSFISYELLEKDISLELNEQENSSIDKCIQEKIQGNAVAYFDYGLFLLSTVDDYDDSDEDYNNFIQGFLYLKQSAELGNCRAIQAIADYMFLYSLIETDFPENWIEEYLSIKTCRRDEIEQYA